MSFRARLSEIWPTLLAVGSVGLIAIYFLKSFFPVWLGSGEQPRSIHITCFAYRDVNRNGIYDMADRPYAGLKVTLDRPREDAVEKESNIAGFTNFVMSLSQEDTDIHSPGEHTIHVAAPRNWEITSGNSTQTIEVSKHARAATGMMVERTFDAVGVAPVLSIAGTVATGDASSNPRLTAHPPGGEPFRVTILEDGSYSFPASTGTWRLELGTGNAESISRDVVVRQYPVVVGQFHSGAHAIEPKPNRRTMGFDDLTLSDTLYEIPNGYGGVNWRNWVATHQKLYQGNGYINGTVSSEYLAYMSSGHPAAISSKQPFDFVGAYVGAAWPEAEGHDVVVRAWRQNNEVHEDRFRASTAGPVHFDADYRGVTKVEFASDGFWQIVVDDITLGSD